MRTNHSRVLNNLRSSIKLHNWYQSLIALDLGSTSIDVNAARYVLVLPMAVNTASLIFEVLPIHVNAAITKEVTTVELKPSPPPTKLSPLVDDDVGEEEAIKKNTRVVNNNNEEDESIEVDEVVNIKESKNHPLEQVIGNVTPPNWVAAELCTGVLLHKYIAQDIR
ncbi:hypothetical protein Tco_1041016 [Tanacetum coccineum]|uniref:Uncharacterized protein n=1 Tax=Tanacetum coccineum TaxID=301880 RepID=A0ABQ5GGG7_9ASTR